MRLHSPSPTLESSRKRLKIDTPDNEAREEPQTTASAGSRNVETETEDNCVICLQVIADRTVLPECAHDRFCFECIEMWCSQSRKCPLCTASIGAYLIHNIRSQYDFQKYYLAPLRTSPPPPTPLIPSGSSNTRRARPAPQVEWGRSRRIEQDELDRAIEKRRWVYRHHLYAKHFGSNTRTRFKPCPTPALFAASPDLISRATMFIRRELQVWVNLDVEFLTSFILALMKSLDIRSEPAVKLLSEFLDVDTPYSETGSKANAEHFAHELYTYLRSPYRDLTMYDNVIQVG
ncbi:hypothetical protein FRB99_008076 [Tulasnella sp. 403]|nr:hypothetical protein FRB99_008076 [Tulasnella sp. 403]